jgi:hypothetical protein
MKLLVESLRDLRPGARPEVDDREARNTRAAESWAAQHKRTWLQCRGRPQDPRDRPQSSDVLNARAEGLGICRASLMHRDPLGVPEPVSTFQAMLSRFDDDTGPGRRARRRDRPPPRPCSVVWNEASAVHRGHAVRSRARCPESAWSATCTYPRMPVADDRGISVLARNGRRRGGDASRRTRPVFCLSCPGDARLQRLRGRD